MKDPKEEEKQALYADEETNEQHEETTQDTNWDTHQQIDEEGNELDPEDIK